MLEPRQIAYKPSYYLAFKPGLRLKKLAYGAFEN